MRLLHSETLQFREFFDRDIPKYAILSHRWGDKEVSFQEMEQNQVPHGPGIEKIKGCCLQARCDGLEWVWVDTCCIDKKSSAELTEAINSMFSWYGRAEICYVYLCDVTSRDEEESHWQFKESQWFTRGWTLQELIAPRRSVFFNAMWEYFGTKKSQSACIAAITNISQITLYTDDVKRHLKLASVAERMSWAAPRVTTRKEDEAYCLLGLFDVNMPLLYGEGAKAFRRLQLEIIKESWDESIFAWGLGVAHPPDHQTPPTSVLAASPRGFANCKKFAQRKNDARTFSVTNLGLKIRVPLQACTFSTGTSCGPALELELNCTSYDQKDCIPHSVVLHLHQDTLQLYGDQKKVWHRWQCNLSNGLRYEEPLRTALSAPTNDTKLYLNIQP